MGKQLTSHTLSCLALTSPARLISAAMDCSFLGQQPNSRVTLLFVAWVLCRVTLLSLQLWIAMMLFLQDMRWARSEKKISCVYCEGFTNTVTVIQGGLCWVSGCTPGRQIGPSLSLWDPWQPALKIPCCRSCWHQQFQGWCRAKALKGMGSCSHAHTGQ